MRPSRCRTESRRGNQGRLVCRLLAVVGQTVPEGPVALAGRPLFHSPAPVVGTPPTGALVARPPYLPTRGATGPSRRVGVLRRLRRQRCEHAPRDVWARATAPQSAEQHAGRGARPWWVEGPASRVRRRGRGPGSTPSLASSLSLHRRPPGVQRPDQKTTRWAIGLSGPSFAAAHRPYPKGRALRGCSRQGPSVF